jgi:hypothetical protein
MLINIMWWCFKKKKKRIVISLIDFNKLLEKQKNIMRYEYDIYFSEFL